MIYIGIYKRGHYKGYFFTKAPMAAYAYELEKNDS